MRSMRTHNCEYFFGIINETKQRAYWDGPGLFEWPGLELSSDFGCRFFPAINLIDRGFSSHV